jgi:hypothetical protein
MSEGELKAEGIKELGQNYAGASEIFTFPGTKLYARECVFLIYKVGPAERRSLRYLISVISNIEGHNVNEVFQV